MSSIRLRKDQIDRLRASGMGAAIIRHAVKRWKRGDFVIGNAETERKDKNLLQIFPIWRKPKGVVDWQIREILDKHFAVKDAVLQARINKELKAAERDVEEQFALYRSKTQAGFIIEEEEQEDDET